MAGEQQHIFLADELRQIENTIRGMIEHENTLMNNRIGWMLTINGFLIAAMSLKSFNSGMKVVGLIIPIIGVMVAIASIVALQIGLKAVKRLRDRLVKIRKNDYFEIGVMGFDEKGKWMSRMAPWSSLPIVFFLIWFVLLVLSLLSLIGIPASLVEYGL